jgi:hypothetical protein
MDEGHVMDLKVPIDIVDELSDEVIKSTGLLDLSSGEIHQVRYQDYDLKTQGLPMENDDYEFTCGVLSNNGKDVEFRVEVDLFSGKYSVSANELLEIKLRAAKLFAGISGEDLLAGSASAKAPANNPAGKTAAKTAVKTAAKKAPMAAPKGRPGSGSLH